MPVIQAPTPKTTLAATRGLAGVLGGLLGDALGAPHEFKPGHSIPPAVGIELVMPASYQKTYASIPYGTWSDDGSQLLCLLQTLSDNQGELDLDDLARQMIAWRHHGRHQAGGVVFDCGSATAASLERLRLGVQADSSGETHDRSQGNGSLMRVLPAALLPAVWSREPADVVEVAVRQSRATHSHPVALACCAVYAQMAQLWLDEPGRGQEDVLAAAFDLVEHHAAFAAPGMQAALGKVSEFGVSEMPTGGGYVVDTLWSSLWAVGRADDYLGAVRGSIGLGNDTDTTACVAGGLAGIRFGLDSVPDPWWGQLRVPAESKKLLLSVFGSNPWLSKLGGGQGAI